MGGPWLIRRADQPEIDLTDGRYRWPCVAASITDENRRLAVYGEWLNILDVDTYTTVSHDLWDSLVGPPPFPSPPPVPPVPVPAGWPTATTTGVPAGTVLTSTPLRRTSAFPAGDIVGQAFDLGTDFVTVDRPTVFRNCRFTASGLISNTMSLVQNQADSVTFEDCTFDGGPSHNRCVWGDRGDITVRRCNFTRFGNSAVEKNDRTGLYSMLVEDSYLYEPKGWPRADHADGLQMGAGKNFTARHNTIAIEPYGATDGDTSYVSNSCIGMWAELGDVTGAVTIVDNRLAGGGSLLYCQAKAPWQFRGAVTIQGNVFDRSRFATTPTKAAIWFVLYPGGLPPGLIWSNNTFDDGTPVTLAQATQ